MLNVTVVAGLRVVCGFGFCRITIVTNTEAETVDAGLTTRVLCVSLDLARILILHHALDADVWPQVTGLSMPLPHTRYRDITNTNAIHK